jgi:hypothetical protein
MFGSSFPSVVCRRAHVLFTFCFVCLCIVVSNTYCVLFLFCFSLSCVPYVVSFCGKSGKRHENNSIPLFNIQFCFMHIQYKWRKYYSRRMSEHTRWRLAVWQELHTIVMPVTIFAWKRCSVRLYLQLFVGGRMSYLVVSNTYCVLFLFCFSLSCVPYVVSFCGLFFFDCSFGIL